GGTDPRRSAAQQSRRPRVAELAHAPPAASGAARGGHHPETGGVRAGLRQAPGRVRPLMQDWRVFRPAIWMAMIGIAVMLLVAPAYFGAALIGAAVGIALKIQTGRRRIARGSPPRRRPPDRAMP